ncbi:MAG: hypothetical protein HYX89_06740, partial [Chloroflexi bacterium]|nr:hypothetical protein [Chloroflexota bacterium]
MVAFLIWLVLIEAIGLLALPLAYRLFSALPDRGYTFTKPLGILIPAYLFWLAAMAGLLENKRLTIAIVFAAFGLASWGLTRISWAELSAFLRQRWRFIALSEGIFIAALAGWSLFRAYDSAITATEKPMEIAFLNAIVRSETLPPPDPWLSGFAISYYYFGYLMMALLTKLSGIASAITFNLSLALLFALTITGSFGLVYNWVASAGGGARWRGVPVTFGLLGALFVTFLGNLEGIWEVLRSNGILPTSFFRWLGIVGLDQLPPQTQLYPTDPPEIWWWWRASRVIGSVNPVTNTPTDYTINEFPFFSFLLGDLHPHVLALPFNLLALGLCLALVVQKEPISLAWLKHNWPLAGLASIVLGALGFLNFWDLPTYLAAFIVAFIIHRVVVAHIRPERALGEGVLFGVAALVASFLLYLPFYYGFSSQASGIGLVFIRSRLPQFLTIWALPLLIAVPFLTFIFARGVRAISEEWDRPWPIVVAVASIILATAVGLLLQAEV